MFSILREYLTKEQETKIFRGIVGNENGNNRTVTFYPYRTAFVSDCIVSVDRDDVFDLEFALATAAGVKKDNHTSYKIEDNTGVVYVSFTDSKALLGVGLNKTPW